MKFLQSIPEGGSDVDDFFFGGAILFRNVQTKPNNAFVIRNVRLGDRLEFFRHGIVEFPRTNVRFSVVRCGVRPFHEPSNGLPAGKSLAYGGHGHSGFLKPHEESRGSYEIRIGIVHVRIGIESSRLEFRFVTYETESRHDHLQSGRIDTASIA